MRQRAAFSKARGRFRVELGPVSCQIARTDKQDVLDRLRENERALRERGATHAALFGSVARGEQGPQSDTDIMVEMAPEAPVGVNEYVGIVRFINELVPTRVDVVERASLKRHVRPFAERDAVYDF